MNRRHLLFNGTISLIFVTQKYTLIPSRIRSNANWIIVYQLNPADFEVVYKDAVVHGRNKWESLLSFVFGKGASINNNDETHKEEEVKQDKVQDIIK